MMQDIAAATMQKQEVMKEVTDAESDLYAKEFENEQLQAQVVSGKVGHMHLHRQGPYA